MVVQALIGGGFVLGLCVGRWWALTAAAALGIYAAVWSEVEVPGWYLGLAYFAMAAASIASGVFFRKLVLTQQRDAN